VGRNSERSISCYGSGSDDFNKNSEFDILYNRKTDVLVNDDNGKIDVLVNMNKRVIYYFINGKQCPYYINNVSSSSSLLFGISAYDSSSIIEVLSIIKMKESYVNPSLECKALEWK
jgi:hypothetical protein